MRRMGLFRGRTPILIGLGVILLAVLGAFAYLLIDSQAKVQKESQKRFHSRAVISAALTESIFSSAGEQGRQSAARMYGGRTVSKAVLAKRVKESKQKYLLVVDGKGKLLAASPGTPSAALADVQRKPIQVTQALKGQAYLSDVISRPNQPDTIEWALPFKTHNGLRVIVSAGRARPFTKFLAAYLDRARESATMDAYVVQSDGKVIASAGTGTKEPTQLGDGLAEALRHGTQGTYGHNAAESYFASTPVAGSGWRVVLSEPTSALYPIFAKGRTWFLWTILIAFAVVGVVSLVLLRRLFGSSEELNDANVSLRQRQDDLAAANRVLEQQTRLAQEASRAKSDFLANMSHELRTPLTAIIGYSELMADDVSGVTEAERAKFLGVVVANARHLEELIDGILDLSKVEAGKMEFHPELVDVRELIDDVVTALHVPVEKKQIELVTEVADEVRSVVTDPVRLKQVAANYLSNALKFTPERGRIQVHVTPDAGDSFKIGVADNGIGIAPEDQKKLFRDFQQVDQTAQKEHQGTGLGLSLVKRIVEIQGGQVGVRSELGKGSEFYAVMPRNSRKVDFHRSAAEDGNGKVAPTIPVLER
jgi:signal transduction histidine kinase